jgi:hypothetical protein
MTIVLPWCSSEFEAGWLSIFPFEPPRSPLLSPKMVTFANLASLEASEELLLHSGPPRPTSQCDFIGWHPVHV